MCNAKSSSRVIRESIYHLYIIGVPFLGSRARKQQIPRLVSSDKSHFFRWSVSEACSGCLQEVPERCFGVPLEGSRTNFCGFGQSLSAECENIFFRCVFLSEEQVSFVAKPCKPYSTSFKNRRLALHGLCPPTCVPRASILCLQSVSLSLLLVADFLVLRHLV